VTDFSLELKMTGSVTIWCW